VPRDKIAAEAMVINLRLFIFMLICLCVSEKIFYYSVTDNLPKW
jgi:hypothetical protein